MGDEHRVVVMEIAVSHASTCHMRHCVVTGQLDYAFVACQHTVLGQCKAFESAFLSQTGKDMRRRAAVVVATLRAHVMEDTGVRNIHFHAFVETRCGRAVLQQRHLGPCIYADHMVQNGIRRRGFMLVLQAYGFGRFARHMDQHAIRCKGCIQCRQRALHRVLTPRFKHAVQITRPVNIGTRFGQTLDADTFQAQIVRLLWVENTVYKNNLKTVYVAEDGGFFDEQRRGHHVRLCECVGSRIFPVFIPSLRQAHSAYPLQGIAARGHCPSTCR